MDEYLESLNSAFDSASSWVSEKWNRFLGYGSAVLDEQVSDVNQWWINANDEPVYPKIPIESTPIFKLLPEANNTSISAAENAAIDKARTISEIDSLRLEFENLIEEGYEYLPNSENLTVLYPDYKEGDKIRVTDGLNRLAELGHQVDQLDVSMFDTEVDPTVASMTNENYARNLVRLNQAISPLLVAGAAWSPQATRELMGVHLLGDALTGVINFRDPDRQANFSFMDVLNPYLTMGSLALVSKATEGV